MNKTFTRLISQNWGYIRRPLTMYIPVEWQADVQQEIIAKAWQLYPSYRGDAKFSTWLYKIALYECYNWSRKLKRPRVDFIEQQVTEPHPSESWFSKIFPTIKPIYQDVLILRYIKGMPLPEIANLTGRPVNTVKTLLARAKASFNHPHKAGE